MIVDCVKRTAKWGVYTECLSSIIKYRCNNGAGPLNLASFSEWPATLSFMKNTLRHTTPINKNCEQVLSIMHIHVSIMHMHETSTTQCFLKGGLNHFIPPTSFHYIQFNLLQCTLNFQQPRILKCERPYFHLYVFFFIVLCIVWFSNEIFHSIHITHSSTQAICKAIRCCWSCCITCEQRSLSTSKPNYIPAAHT